MNDTHALYQSLWKNIPLGVFRMTFEPLPTLISGNPAFAGLYGYEGSDAVSGLPVSSFFADPVDLANIFVSLQADGKIHEAMCRQFKRDGTPFWVSIHAERVQEGQTSYCDGIVQDVTDRKRLETIIERGKREWETIFDTLSELTFVTDLEHRIVRCNRATMAGLGKTFQQIIGQPIMSVFFGDARPEIDPFEAGVRETHIPRLGGDYSVTSYPLRNVTVIQGMVHVMMDITERKRSEAMIREREANYRTLAEKSLAGVYVVQQGVYRFINANAASYTGYSVEELTGTQTSRVIHPDDRQTARRLASEMLKGQRSAPYEFRLLTKENTVRWIMETVSSITYEGNRAILGNCMDITERRQQEVQNLQSQKLESVGQLAAGIAHEINTPIQFVGDNINFLGDVFRDLLGLLQLCEALRDGEEPDASLKEKILSKLEEVDPDYVRDEIPRAVEQSQDGISRVTRIVRAMREFSHPGGEEKTEMDLNKALESTITLTRNEWKYTADLTTDFAPDLPPVRCYPADLNQVVLNVIVNAAHAVQDKIGKGGKEKGLIRVFTQRVGDDVEIGVSDTGTGIPPEAQSRVFDPFFTTKSVGRGTGQGLAIAHNIIVRKHGGRIFFETKPGEGTTFHIRLPLEPPSPPPSA